MVLLQEALSIEGCHATRASTGDGLTVNVVLHVACCEHAGHRSLGRKALQAALGHDVAVFQFKLTLENFSSDFIITDQQRLIKKTVTEGKTTRQIEVQGWYVEGVANVSAGFRLYDPKDRNMVDQQRFEKKNLWSAEGETKAQALALLITKADAARAVGEMAGAGYATKIAPMYAEINRGFFPRSKTDPAVSKGARLAEVDQWEQAIETWKAALPGVDEESGGMLAYNIGVGYEVLGSLDLAKQWAGRAYTDFGLKKGRNYVRTLNGLINQQILLEQQMQKEIKLDEN